MRRLQVDFSKISFIIFHQIYIFCLEAPAFSHFRFSASKNVQLSFAIHCLEIKPPVFIVGNKGKSKNVDKNNMFLFFFYLSITSFIFLFLFFIIFIFFVIITRWCAAGVKDTSKTNCISEPCSNFNWDCRNQHCVLGLGE